MPKHYDALKDERDRSETMPPIPVRDNGPAALKPGTDSHPDSHNSLPRMGPPERDLDLDTTPVQEEEAALQADEADIPLSLRQRHHDVVALAWPSVTTMLFQTFNGMMDTLFVGHMRNGEQALAATGVGGQVVFLLISLAMGVSVGTTALVSRFTGAKEPENAVRATAQSLTLSVLLGVFFYAAFWIGRGAMVHAMLGSEAGAAASAVLCLQFLAMAMLATVPLFVMNVLMAAFRGIGDTRTPLYVQIAVIATHISFNWLLIYGHFGFPAMGVQGAGLAFAISLFVGTALYFIALKRTELGASLRLRELRFRLEWARRILKIGIPASIQAVIRTVGMMSFTGMLARTVEGAAAVAAMQIGIRAEAIAFMPGFGYSVAASTLVGQSLGAKNPKRAEQYGLAATVQGMAVMAVMATVFYVLAGPITNLFNNEPNVHALGVNYLRVNAWCEPFLALGMVLTGALQGAGDTVRPTYITFFTMWIVRMPLAYLLMFTLNLQTHGAWLSMCVTTIIGGIMTWFLFKSGAWKKTKV